MTTLQRLLLATFVATLLSACGSSEPPPPPPVKDTVFGDMAGAMDKARGVQDTVDAQKAAHDREISAQEEATTAQ
jgi:hypothetical protein